MAFDWGILIALAVIAYIIAIGYKKKTGRPISELWKNREAKTFENPISEYRKVYITKGIKQ